MILLDGVATILLSPLLLAQAISLRKRALRLPEASGPRSGTIGTGPALRLLVVGDSSAAGVGVQTQSQALAGQLSDGLSVQHTVAWHLVASTGATTPSTLSQLASEDLPRADIILIVLGVNDVTRGGPQSRWLRDHADLRATLRRRTGAAHLYVSQIPPLGAFPLLPDPLRWLLGRRGLRFDAALHATLRREADCTYVPFPDTLAPSDMAEDGFHPGPRIYSEWAKNLARRILTDGPILKQS